MAFPDGWGRKCELVIQHGQVDATLSNFPTLITKDTLPSEIFDADGSYPALNGGGDIRFSSDTDGNTQLACEIEQFVTDNNPDNGKAAIWVKVPSVASAANTSIWIWYNKSGESQPAEGAAYGKHAVWDSNYKMVQHMNQDPSGSSPQMIDSTSNSNDGTSAGGMVSGDLVDGKTGKCLEFNGSQSIILTGMTDAGSAQTLEMWINATGSTVQYAFDIQTGRLIFAYRGDDWTSIGLYDGTATWKYFGNSPSVGSWHHMVFILDGTNAKCYIDGSQLGSTLSYTSRAVGGNIRLGSRHSGTYAVPGKIDEARLSNTARATGWITTEYNNQNSPATFIIEGTPETPSAVITLTVAAMDGSGALDNIVLTQKHTLAIQALVSAGLLDNITLELSTLLVVAEALSLGAIDNVMLTQKNILAIQELISAGALDNIGLIQKHALIVAEIFNSGALDNITLTQKHVLVMQEIASLGTIDNVDLSLSALLIVSDLLTSGSLDNIVLTQEHLLAIQELFSSGILDNVNLVQKHTLAIQELLGVGTIDNIDLVFATLLVVAEMLSSGAIDNADLTQKHILSVEQIKTTGLLDNVILTQKNLLIIQELLSSGVIDEIEFDIAAGIICITLTQSSEYNIISNQDVEYNILLIQKGGGVC